MSTLQEIITDATGSDINVNRLVRWMRKRNFNGQITIICYGREYRWCVYPNGHERHTGR
jgi:hypothetical protein